MVVNSNCYRTLTSNMATCIVRALFVVCSVHSISIFVESKNLETLHVPQNVPAGRILTRFDGWGRNSKFHCMNSDAKGLFSLLKDGNLVRSNNGNLTHLIGKTVSFIAKHPDTHLQDVLYLKIVEDKLSLYFPQQRYQGTVKENEAPHTQVLLDRDLYAVSAENNPISYSIVSPDSDKFNLIHVQFSDKDIVVIKTKVSLDREEKDEYEIVVRADFDSDFAECLVYIRILDKNDNSPFFSQYVYSAVYSEPIPDGSKIWTLHATDLDLSPVIHYSLLDDTNFSIDSETGVVSTKCVGYMEPGHYTSAAVAKDEAGHTSEPVSLLLNIEDTLKFTPHFSHRSRRDVEVLPTIHKTVPENVQGSKRLFTIAPESPTSTEEYNIVYASVDLFQVDSNGNVYLKSSGVLDYENPSHRFISLQFNITDNQSEYSDIM